ncbi:MAG: MotA/TolQ/ExbB proton channel family protein [Sphingomonadales bacterium]|nr:MotA/TolQ/ExbB proton channel family protein [Sphingomonadales bacterium]
MLFQILDAAAGAAPAPNKFGFSEMMFPNGEPNYIALTVAIFLAIMSFGSFFILFTKWFDQGKIMKEARTLSTTFWRAPTVKDGATKLEKNGAWRQLVDDAVNAEDQAAKMTDALESHDWLHNSLARSEGFINGRLAQGLPFLATVGSTSPFIGLFGTVVGIYKALIAIGIAGSASIDKVAGPVGEALIMTAIGLLVAVPAVLAYNYLQARNKRIAEMLSAFSNDLLANISSKGAIKPQHAATAAAGVAKPAAAPAKA